MDITYAYLDLNVFDKIEKKEILDTQQRNIFQRIEQLILEKRIFTPYSNAHINDLLRGYFKNPKYLPGHLENLKKLTQNLCIVQYWNHENVTWHYRDVEEFFNSSKKAQENDVNSFSGLFNIEELFEPSMEEQDSVTKLIEDLLRQGFNNVQKFISSQGSLGELRLIQEEFKEICERIPIFDKIFHRTKKEMNNQALVEDIFELTKIIKKDYPIYKGLRAIISQFKKEFKRHPTILNGIEKIFLTTPKHLLYEKILEKYAPKTNIGKNPIYQKILATYWKVDLRGYKSDDLFLIL